MNAFRSWETLFLLVTSSLGWTREALAIVTTTTCPNQRVSCPGYGDDSGNKYCCPSSIQQGGFYCCNYWEKEMSNNDYSENIPEIIGGVVGAVCLVASILVLSCFFCKCCYVYKYRHRKRHASEPAIRRPSSNLGWRYRNWPRSSFVPSSTTASSCNNGNSSSSASNRYYYNNRPLRGEATAAQQSSSSSSSHYHHHHHSHHHGSSFTSPRNRHDSQHSRLQSSDHSSLSRNNEFCHRDNNDGGGFVSSGRPVYSPYLYQPIHTILSEAKAFEAPPPYPIAQFYPTCPPIGISAVDHQHHQQSGGRSGAPGEVAISPVSTSTSGATSTTIIQDDPVGGRNRSSLNGETISPPANGYVDDFGPKPSSS